MKMEIIYSAQFKRANIKFDGKPSEEVREELKKEGWFYSKNHNLWYPKNDAAENSQKFAEHIRDVFFSDESVDIITEASEKEDIIQMIRDDIPLNEILERMSDFYGCEIIAKVLVKSSIDYSKSIIEHDEETNTSAINKKFAGIIEDVFLKVTDEEKEAGTTEEHKATRYNKWFSPMVDEIAAQISCDKDVRDKIEAFDINKENHVEGNKWYTPDEAYVRDVQYKLLPELYEIVQNKIKENFDKDKIPYVVMFSSESSHFPTENKVYTVMEFNKLLLEADKEFHNRKKYAEEKYGSADAYWDLERDDKLPEEDKGIQFGYDKTNFKLFNIPNPNNSEDTLIYEPSRYDIGDGNGSVFDYVRSTCSHDEFINALNDLETKLYFNVNASQIEAVSEICRKGSLKLEKDLVVAMEVLDVAHNEYKELHKKWLIESSESDRVDAAIKEALAGVKSVYEKAVKDMYKKIQKFYPIFENDLGDFAVNEIKKVVVSSLYKPSRDAQKAMNEEDYKTYNSVDWAKLRRVWEQFPANCNMTEYISELCK